MARKAPVSLFISDRGSRYLFINGSAARAAWNAWAEGAHQFPQPLANFAKIAVVQRTDGTVSFVVKASATHPYTSITVGDAEARARLAHAMRRDVFPGQPYADRMHALILATLRGEATASMFGDVATMLPQEREEAPPQPQPAPQPAPQRESTPGTPAPSPAPQGAGLLDAFGDFGRSIHGAIVTVVERAVADLPKGGAAVTITVPGYTPVTLPDGEVTHEAFPGLLRRCTAQQPKDRNVLLLGPRGSGKTHAAEQVARSLGMRFDAVSMSGGTTERAFWGSTTIRDGNMTWKPSRFVDAFRTGGVFLIDELDKADATVVTALNMATSNGYICPADSDERITRHADFIVIAGANALASDRAYTGSTRLDASSLDRFAIMRWDYSPAITARVAAECGDARTADWIVRLSDAMRARIDSKSWRGEVEWGTRTVARVASWLRSGCSRAEAVAMELDAMPANVRTELATVAHGIA